MRFRSSTLPIVAIALVVGFLAGCDLKDKWSNDKTVVAEVAGQQVTASDWSKHLDLYRVVSPGVVDPNDPNHVKEVLESLIDQDVVLAAARKEKYSSSELDAELNKGLPEAAQQLQELHSKLEKDLAAVTRLQKTFKEDYTKMLTAQSYAKDKVKDVVVTEKDIRDRYDVYAKEAASQNQKPIEYAKVHDKIKVRAMADKLLAQLRVDYKVSRHEDAIQKYLAKISPSQEALQGKDR
jgi:hypothetical protein